MLLSPILVHSRALLPSAAADFTSSAPQLVRHAYASGVQEDRLEAALGAEDPPWVLEAARREEDHQEVKDRPRQHRREDHHAA